MTEKKIRIAVAVCSEGHWAVAKDPDDALDLFAYECTDKCTGESVHFVTAAIPLPQSVEVPGEVEP